MKITILLRYPKFENSLWKKNLIERMIQQDYQVSLVYGDSSLFKQLKTAIKLFGFHLLKKKREISEEQRINIFKYFQKKIPVYKTGNLNASASEIIIRKLDPDFLLLLGSGIIKKNILKIPLKKTVHCHHGYLPKYRGVSTAEWSLFYENEVYLTTHFVDAGIDTGEIILRRKVRIDTGDSIEIVRKKCREQSVELLLDTFKLLINENIRIEKQIPSDGKQFYEMHPFFKQIVELKLKNLT